MLYLWDYKSGKCDMLHQLKLITQLVVKWSASSFINNMILLCLKKPHELNEEMISLKQDVWNENFNNQLHQQMSVLSSQHYFQKVSNQVLLYKTQWNHTLHNKPPI